MRTSVCDVCHEEAVYIDDTDMRLCEKHAIERRRARHRIKLMCINCDFEANCTGITITKDKRGYFKTNYDGNPMCSTCCTHEKCESVPWLISRTPLQIIEEHIKKKEGTE